MESFLDINFISITRNYNQIVDALVGKGAHFNLTHHRRVSSGVKVLCRPSIPNTVKFWQVFDPDEHIINFLVDELVAHTFGVI